MKKLILVAVMIAVLFAGALGRIDPQYTLLHFVWAADSYGNDIISIEVWQYNTTNWNLLANLTSSGGSVRVHDSWEINFTVQIKFNDTLAASTSEAIDYTNVTMNITHGTGPTYDWTNVELNNTSCQDIGNFYFLKEQGHWHETGKPQEGITYECAVLFKGYY